MVGDAEDDVFGGVAYEDMDWRERFGVFGVVVLFDCRLHAVSYKFPDHVFEVGGNVGKDGVEVAFDLEFGDWDVFAVGDASEAGREVEAFFDDFFSVAAEKDLADDFRMAVWLSVRICVRKVEW